MTYSAIVEMIKNSSLRERVLACVAQEGIANPDSWVATNMWKVVTSAGWADDWDYANNTYNVNQNPDTGARVDVISDGKILSAVQAINAAAPPV